MNKNKTSLLAIACLLTGISGCGDNDSNDNAFINTSPCQGAEGTLSRLFLQQLTDSSVIIKWRGDATGVCVGMQMDALDTFVEATDTDDNHREVLVTGLTPQTLYYYSVGGAATAPATQLFTTSPIPGDLPQDGNTRIWLIGDSGTGGDDERDDHEGEAAQVLAGMQTFAAADGENVDVFLMLGDNAYTSGTDFNYQQAVFETYPELLMQTSVWPTIGNHEMGLFGVSSDPDPQKYFEFPGDELSRMPYLGIFSLPADGQAGGVASGTEQYYSFDYGNVHIVSLDSQLSARDDAQRATMRSWVIDDLSSNNADWTVVIFHHPPYSKGANHDSDTTELRGLIDLPQRLMREEFVGVFDTYGVDVVYGGHSHSYERSFYLRGHTGTSDTFTPAAHAELVGGDPALPASGRAGETYAQLSPTSGGIDDRVVYTVAGNSGKADSSAGSLTDPAVWLRHAAHIEQPADTVMPKRRGMNVLGSVIVDASANELKASFIDDSGAVLDSFTITR